MLTAATLPLDPLSILQAVTQTGWRAAINQGCSTGKLGGGLITWLLALHS